MYNCRHYYRRLSKNQTNDVCVVCRGCYERFFIYIPPARAKKERGMISVGSPVSGICVALFTELVPPYPLSTTTCTCVGVPESCVTPGVVEIALIVIVPVGVTDMLGVGDS